MSTANRASIIAAYASAEKMTREQMEAYCRKSYKHGFLPTGSMPWDKKLFDELWALKGKFDEYYKAAGII